ncbi:MAG TPA: VWA domain-containing protein [Pyrinomonadaceae bacterium]|jgi:VWFA-related protein
MLSETNTRHAALLKARLFVLLGMLIACAWMMPVLAQNDDEDKITVRTRVVFIDALVKDKKNDAPVRNLTRNNFTVLDDGRERELTYFSTGIETRRPRALMLVIDFYGHWGRTFHNKEAVSRLASAFAKLPPEDEVAIAVSWLGKADSPCSPLNPDSRQTPPPLHMLQDFTRDRKKIIAAFESVLDLSAKYERDYKQIDWSYSVVNTASGIACATETLRRAAVERPNSQAVMVVAADDLTYFPFAVRDEMIRSLLETGITVNLLRIRTFFLTGWAADIAKKTDFREMPGTVEVVADITKQTGGEMARVGSVKKYVEAFEKLVNNLTSRYTLGFTLEENEQNKGRLHKLEIKVKAHDERGKERKVTVSARNGYYLPKE